MSTPVHLFRMSDGAIVLKIENSWLFCSCDAYFESGADGQVCMHDEAVEKKLKESTTKHFIFLVQLKPSEVSDVMTKEAYDAIVTTLRDYKTAAREELVVRLIDVLSSAGVF